MYSVSIVVWREVSERSEKISLGKAQASVVYTMKEMAHACTTTFAFNPDDVIRRARASAEETWPRDEGWGEPYVSVVEIPIPEKIVARAIQERSAIEL